ncbi:MAG: septum formation initiator family protein, partial [Cellulomonas sp.]|nr:septum formation initiator family protein [Cellulomonas sp.]
TSQARSRLSFVLPGERAFRVVDPDTAVDEPESGDGPVSVSGSDRAWYSDVWTSVKVAGG